MRSIVVWDLPTRIFHWTLTVLVILDLTVEAEEGWLLVLHSYAGYLVLLLVLFRLAWGVVGGEHARFGDFVAPWPVVRDYARRAVTGKAPGVIGHNPLGGWMIVLMLATLLVVAVTGIAALGEEGGRGPLSAVVAPGLAEALEEVHEGAADFLLYLVVVHVLGGIVTSLLARENLVRAMVTGRKQVPDSGPERDARAVGLWRAAVLAAMLAIFGGWLVANTSFDAGERGWEEEHDDAREDAEEARGAEDADEDED